MTFICLPGGCPRFNPNESSFPNPFSFGLLSPSFAHRQKIARRIWKLFVHSRMSLEPPTPRCEHAIEDRRGRAVRCRGQVVFRWALMVRLVERDLSGLEEPLEPVPDLFKGDLCL